MIAKLRRKIAGLFLRENWMIGWVDAPIEQALHWRQVPPPHWIGGRSRSGYLADPFAWPERTDTLLCETYDFKTQRGSIAQLTLKDGAIQSETPVDLPVGGHLSYPFLFAHAGEVYCLPESSEAGCLTLLRRDGAEWRRAAVPLPDVAAADSSLFEHDGHFWIAYTDLALGRFDNLNLCYAASLSGPWRRHPANPVKRDLASSRGGGTPFRAGGRLYRPAQDCSRHYGGAIRIMEITACTPERYEEREVARIAPPPGLNPHGFHTLSAWGGKCLIDAKRMEISPRQALDKIARRAKALL